MIRDDIPSLRIEGQVSDKFNEQSKIEIQIATYREIALRVREPETLKFIEDRIADLKRRLRSDRT